MKLTKKSLNRMAIGKNMLNLEMLICEKFNFSNISF